MINKGRSRKLVFCGFFLFLFLLIIQCSASPHLSKTFQIPSNEKEGKIPLRAGLYLKPELKECSIVGDYRYVRAVAHLEDALARNATRMVKNLFDAVIVVENLDSEFDKTKVDVIITPELERTLLDTLPYTLPPVTFHCLSLIKWNILTPNGRILYVNTIVGEGTFKGRWGDDINSCMENMIIDQFTKAQEDIGTARWWQGIVKK